MERRQSKGRKSFNVDCAPGNGGEERENRLKERVELRKKRAQL